MVWFDGLSADFVYLLNAWIEDEKKMSVFVNDGKPPALVYRIHTTATYVVELNVTLELLCHAKSR